MDCRRYSAASRLEVLLDEDDVRFFDELLNSEMFCFFYNCMWQSWYSEVSVGLLQLGALLSTNGSPFLFDLLLQFVGIDTQLWMDFNLPTGLTVLVEFLVPSWPNKTSFSIFWVDSCPPTGLTVLDQWVFGSGWIRWVSLLLPATSESNSFIQLSLKKIVGGGRGDTKTFLVCDFSRFHHNNFRDTISWERIVKDDCITSCLLELQTFPMSKLNIDPIHRVIVPFPRFRLAPCKTWFGHVKLIWIFVILVHRIHSRKEYCMSVPA